MPDSTTRRSNAGQFRKGHDHRRHRFTREECQRGGYAGFWAALESISVRYNDGRALTFGRYLRRKGGFR